MAQTIALQRGTTSVTSDYGSVTLFTQSGGTATRVIVNSISVYFPTPPDTGTVYITLFVTQSGGQSTMLGHLRTTNRTKSYQFTAGASTDNQFAGVGLSQFNSSTNSVVASTPIIYANNNNGPAGAGNVVGMEWSTLANSHFGMLNSNFYIGPSDLVGMRISANKVSGKGTIQVTGNISYSFTTITES